MSEPPNTPATILVGSHHHSGGGPATTSTAIVRDYRKGNWTLQETLILIQAKKLDDERRIKANSTPPDPKTPPFRTGELRWKWVENYCWNNGCLRSQNQCNDKWDNLLRDYKKVREYQLRSDGSDELPSYWNMEKHDRKNRNLPSNLSPEIYEALNEVVHRRSYPQKTNQPASALASPATVPALPPPPVTSQAAASETSESSHTNRSEKSGSDKKRKKIENLESSIFESASVIAGALQSCEEKTKKRHRQIMELEERRLRIEETRNEVTRQGLAGLVGAINSLSGAIQSLISDRRDHT